MNHSTYREAAIYYQEMARSAAQSRNIVVARNAYLRCIHALKLAANEFPSLKISQHAAQAEYAQFVRSCRTYRSIFPEIKKHLEKHPDFSRHDLISALHGFNRDDLDYILDFAEKYGEIVKIKEGTEFYFSLPTNKSKNRFRMLFYKLYLRKRQPSRSPVLLQKEQNERVYNSLNFLLATSHEVYLHSKFSRPSFLRKQMDQLLPSI
jgi:hypothetical protein